MRLPLLRIATVWVLEATGLLLLAWVVPAVDVHGAAGALSAVAAIGILNAVFYPLVVRVVLAIEPVLFVLGALVLNAAVVVLAGALVDGFEVGGVGSALVVVLFLTLVNMVATGLLAIDDEGSFHRGVALRQAKRASDRAVSDVPGVLFLEIDGLSAPVLRQALDGGHMPHLAAWVAAGSHTITPWECDLSSQTSASQAGLLHGSNEGIPAFRWYDRAEGRIVVSTSDAALIERRASNGAGLLADGGASRGNLVTGDAAEVAMTISALRSDRAERLARADAWRAYLGNPYSLPRTVLMFAGDVITELRWARRQRRQDVQPRIDRRAGYAVLRAATTSFLVDASVSMIIGDVFAGVPSAYVTFVAYDEVAHHSGITAPDALGILSRLDRQIARIESATRLAPRPYRLVVLSDHGQSEGATFRQRHGETLEDVVRRLTKATVSGSVDGTEEATAHIGVALGEATEAGGSRAVRSTARRAQARLPEAPSPAGDAELLVFGSGNLGLIYFPGASQRLTIDAIQRRYPALIEGLAEHPGIAFVAGVREDGTRLALGPGGSHDVGRGQVLGTDPLAGFGPHAAAHVARELGFANAPDLLVNGSFDPEDGAVGAFEELVGSHGGLGGPQSRPFVLHPSELAVPVEELVGAAAVHHLLKSWLGQP